MKITLENGKIISYDNRTDEIFLNEFVKGFIAVMLADGVSEEIILDAMQEEINERRAKAKRLCKKK